MKRLFIVGIIFLSALSCKENQSIQPKDKFTEVIAALTAIHKEALTFQIQNTKAFLTVDKSGNFVMDEAGLAKKTIEHVNKKFVNLGSDFKLDQIVTSIYQPKSKSMRLAAYDDNYPGLMRGYADDMAEAQTYEQSSSVIYNYQQQTIYSSLSYDDQIQTLSFIQAGQAMSDYYYSGHLARDYGDIFPGYNDAQSQVYGGCAVDWRGVFIGATRSFFAGLVGGCYAGATGGTIVIPGAGTVAGCVGVGIVSGAAGFAGGVGWGIVDNLIATCSR